MIYNQYSYKKIVYVECKWKNTFLFYTIFDVKLSKNLPEWEKNVNAKSNFLAPVTVCYLVQAFYYWNTNYKSTLTIEMYIIH